ncbi:AI-2E family transporter [Weissella tructae]|jgi:predicted PurR-regulated permease PerM|uniref:TqsA protein n=2 Tax=Weissella TaxID=46255 RepID=A0A075U7U3_9LACO|nr:MULTISPECIES: AI-2E family transporter [Weissella]AIG66177.1 TqsA protein [Weissella tructae]AIM63559.1 TqsA protein [Weissella ceti]AIM64894.1 TqsA protein [Weissella ceti]ELA07549.1 permease [Weissella ceti NC36]QVV91326.1 AI-2E family transporter [Weissella tructae]
MQNVTHSKTFYWTLEILAIATLFWVLSQLGFILTPMGQFIGGVFVPLLISGFLYYLMNPIVELICKVPLGKYKVPRGISITIVMLLFLGIIVFAVGSFIPTLAEQVSRLLASVPQYVHKTQMWFDSLSRETWFRDYVQAIDMSKLQQTIEKYGETVVMGTASGFGSVLGTVTSVTIAAITIPVMTIYMLADGKKFVPFAQRVMPKRFSGDVAELLGRLNKTLSRYISGQALEMLFVGVFTTIGYMVIGQRYALLLGVIAGITNMIPYVGPYIGYIPALFIGLMQGPMEAVSITIVVLIVQQIDSNILYPRIIGSTLSIHPLTILVILLAAGNIAGIPGMILAVPLYAVVRTIVVYIAEVWKVDRQSKAEESITK